jgi:hypothetical protein
MALSETDAALDLRAPHRLIATPQSTARRRDRPEPTALAHRDLRQLRDDRAERLVQRRLRNRPGGKSAPQPAFSLTGSAPQGGAGFPAARSAECHRVLLRFACDPVKHGFHDVGGMRAADRTPPEPAPTFVLYVSTRKSWRPYLAGHAFD